MRAAITETWIILDGAGHDLELPGQLRQTLAALERLICAVAAFSGCSGCD